ncbi:MAG TPA: hypothetical protein VGE74_00150 [Gemmata sp.]
MNLPLKEIARYTRSASTEELLDRVTVDREGMEPAALDLMEGELDRRGVTRAQIADHDAKFRTAAVRRPDGTARRCERCDRLAVVETRGWYRWRARVPMLPLLLGRADAPLGFSVPLFPRLFAYCEAHRPAPDANPDATSGS